MKKYWRYLVKMADEEVKEEKKEEKKEKKEIWSITSIATATEPIIVNRKTDEQLSVVDALAKILNKLEKLEDLL